MNPRDCEMTLLVQADFDGELDAAQAAALAAHRTDCARCQASYRALAATREAIRDGASYHHASAALRRAIEARVTVAPPPSRRRPAGWREAAAFAVGAALAASLVLMVRPGGEPGLLGAVIDDHVRALQPGHFTDVISTDQHTVKPWFDGRLDFAPPVKDLAPAGFALVGGRLDYLAGRTVAALAYQHGKHPIDLFVWPEAGGDRAQADAQRNGYNVISWREHGMALWAVSDVERDQLEAFVRDWRAAP
jgi:anti-sigma factor RsiW